MEDDHLVDLFIERADDISLVGNLYKGIVEDVLPGLKAAFIDIGMERRAFLHFSDFTVESLDPAGKKKRRSFEHKTKDVGKSEQEQRKVASHPWSVLQKGQSLIVQVIKDEIGTKGPRVSTNISLPGRFLVLLPYPSQHGGISRKIENEKERQRLRQILSDIRTPHRSFIIRTAGMGMSDDAIKKDIGHLRNIWGNILRKFRHKGAPLLLYNERDILYRIVRDYFSEDIDEIIIDDSLTGKKIRKILKQMIPGLSDRIHIFDQSTSLFHYYNVEKQIRRACERKVWLKNGGYVVFDETEAITAIDVNSGRFVSKRDQEKTVLKTNLEACKVIVQQLRLRDIGGLIVIDFIDMMDPENPRAVEREMQKYLKSDRAKSSCLPISEFGLLQMTRKRVRESLGHQIFTKCPYCEGSGRVLSLNQIWLQIKYALLEVLHKKPRPVEVTIMTHPRTKSYVQEKIPASLKQISRKYKASIALLSSEDLHIEEFQVRYVLPDRTEILPRGLKSNHHRP